MTNVFKALSEEVKQVSRQLEILTAKLEALSTAFGFAGDLEPAPSYEQYIGGSDYVIIGDMESDFQAQELQVGEE